MVRLNLWTEIMSLNAGTIEYTVSVETQQSIDAANKVNQSLDKTEKQMVDTDKAANQLNTGLSKLAKGIAAVALGAAIKELASMVQGYKEMAERVKMATESVDEFEMVQARLLETANGTYRSLTEAQEVYIRTSSSLKGMGYSTEQALDIVDSLSYAFVTNATSSEKAASALNALTAVTATGKVTAMQWLTTMGAVPSVVEDIAAASGKSANQIRELGASGKLTARELTEGLKTALDKNKESADAMATTLGDAAVRMRTGITLIAAGLEQQTGAIQLVTDSIIGAADAMVSFGGDAEKMDVLLKTAEVAGASLAAVLVARVITSIGATTASLYASTIAATNKARADVAAAQAATVLAAQNLIVASSAAKASAGLSTHAAAAKALAVAELQAKGATDALAAAQTRLSGVMSISTRVAGGLRTAMAFLGGPLGIVMLAAAAIYTFGSNAKGAKQPVIELTTAVKDLSKAQRELAILETTKKLEDLSKQAKQTAYNIDYLTKAEDTNDKYSKRRAEMIIEGTAALESQNNEIQEHAKRLAELKNYTPDTKVKDGLDETNESLRDGSKAAVEYAEKMGRALEDNKDASNLGKLLRDMRDNAVEWKNATKENIDAAIANAIALDEYEKSVKKAGNGTVKLTEAQKAAKKSAEDMKNASRENAKVINDLAEQIYQTFLNADELAKRQAELSLNEYATPEQVAQVRAMAGELQKLNDIQSRKDVFKDGTDSTIRGDVPVLQGGGFDDGTARYEAEAEAEQQRYAEQLERMQEAEELKLEVAGGYDLMREQLYQEHSDRMAEIDRVRTEMQLTQWAQGFGDMSKNLADFANTFAKENKAMFAVSKAAAIAQAVINTYQAATGAMSAMSAIPIVGPALGIVAAAAAVAGGLAQVANIRNQQMGGGRRYGGAVNDNKYYRVNEDGRPEIFKGADGSQYMMPNQRGEVVSHDDAIGGQQRAGNTVNVVQNITMRSDNGNYTAKQVMLESSRRQSIAEARLG